MQRADRRGLVRNRQAFSGSPRPAPRRCRTDHQGTNTAAQLHQLRDGPFGLVGAVQDPGPLALGTGGGLALPGARLLVDPAVQDAPGRLGLCCRR
ncbi:hypothetical protein GCM10010303_44350 [Streptomyces purpurascens]|nr:hypothetical protein GCM10010303_44350 [Streptomyces purpurascens]